jgi:trehalose synthase
MELNQDNHLDRYEPLVGEETVARIREKASQLTDLHIAHVNSTYYGGGVAELLSSLTLLMNSLGIKTGWRVIQGAPDFFSVTKKMHNALQGGEINLTERKKKIYQEVIRQNVQRNHIDHDFVFIHDPQPLAMIEHYQKRGPWIWRCHVDLTDPDQELWHFLKPWVELYDAVVVTLDDYALDINTPQVFIKPAINPFTIKNQQFTEKEIKDRLDYYDIPTDLPLITQISRFDKWKDPKGVIDAFNLASKEIDARLVLLGNVATDDPEGEQVYQDLLKYQNEHIIILSREDTALVNALQRHSAVVVQKSIREGFGLTVTEAMWKGAAVIGGNVGGIRVQIEDGETGYLVDSVEQAAERMVELVRKPEKRKQMGQAAREIVRENFLLTRLLEDHLDLISSFKTIYELDETELPQRQVA